jgi:hypothetical protein
MMGGLLTPLSAQGGSQVIFEGLSGQPLIDSLSLRYTPAVVLSYADARDTLYAKILIKEDSIACVYSGHKLYLDLTQDPTQYLYQGGGNNGINTEHAFPQTKGAAGGNARSDMHHIFPTRIIVNEARADKPFAEIPDAQTEKWYYRNQVVTNIPTQNKDRYAESRQNAFEPRESVKGDIARAVFYFYTMYRDMADAADPMFFSGQRETLCGWNEADPVDSSEMEKTWKIAHYQADKPNPFVVDCTLATRSWCPELIAGCLSTTTNLRSRTRFHVDIFPNPVYEKNIRGILEMEQPGTLSIEQWTPFGQCLARHLITAIAAGNQRLEVNNQLPAGPGYLRIIWEDSAGAQVIWRKLENLLGF